MPILLERLKVLGGIDVGLNRKPAFVRRQIGRRSWGPKCKLSPKFHLKTFKPKPTPGLGSLVKPAPNSGLSVGSGTPSSVVLHV
jgi:hypothetical protein